MFEDLRPIASIFCEQNHRKILKTKIRKTGGWLHHSWSRRTKNDEPRTNSRLATGYTQLHLTSPFNRSTVTRIVEEERCQLLPWFIALRAASRSTNPLLLARDAERRNRPGRRRSRHRWLRRPTSGFCPQLSYASSWESSARTASTSARSAPP